jgi:Ca-activated chloride channel family protein
MELALHASRTRARLTTALALLFFLAAPLPARPGGTDLDAVGAGELLARTDRGLVPLPVLDVDVEIAVAGVLARGRIVQEFVNPGPGTIEATYAFPVPDGAAVHHMEMRIGERHVVSEIREREVAQRTFETARATGRKAAVVHRQRPDLFTAAVTNVGPGERVAVVVEISQELAAIDGVYSLRFPLTFLPRYDEGAPLETRERDAETSSSPVDPPVTPLASIAVSLEAGVPLADVHSPSHAIERAPTATGIAVRTPSETVGDRDFVLRWRPAPAADPTVAFLTEEHDGTIYGLAVVHPPSAGDDGPGLPTETVLVVDVSGSMSGPSIVHAKAAVDAALARLARDDRFDLVAFSDGTETFDGSLPFAEEDTVERARAWVRRLEPAGGTRMTPALQAAFDLLDREGGAGREGRVVFLTDGAIGSEASLFDTIVARGGGSRLHAVGIGHAPNAHLVRKMARLGGGLAELVADPAKDGGRMAHFLDRIARPVVDDVRLTWERGDAPAETLTAGARTVYAGEPVVLWLRWPEGAVLPDTLRVSGWTRSGPLDFAARLHPVEGHGIARRWARARIDALEDATWEGADFETVRREIVDLALGFGLVTAHTSLVAVEDVPTALETPRLVRIGGVLPTGGTLERVWLLAGLALAAGGTLLLAAARALAR